MWTVVGVLSMLLCVSGMIHGVHQNKLQHGTKSLGLFYSFLSFKTHIHGFRKAVGRIGFYISAKFLANQTLIFCTVNKTVQCCNRSWSTLCYRH